MQILNGGGSDVEPNSNTDSNINNNTNSNILSSKEEIETNEEQTKPFQKNGVLDWTVYNPHGNNDSRAVAIAILRKIDEKRAVVNLPLIINPSNSFKPSIVKAQELYKLSEVLIRAKNKEGLNVHKIAFDEIVKIIDWFAEENFIKKSPEYLQINTVLKNFTEYQRKANAPKKVTDCEDFKEAFTEYWQGRNGFGFEWDNQDLKAIESLKVYYTKNDPINALLIFKAMLNSQDAFTKKLNYTPKGFDKNKQSLTAKTKQKNESGTNHLQNESFEDLLRSGFIK